VTDQNATTLRGRSLAAVLLLAAAALRLAGINDQLWLDEIWSINLGHKADSVRDVLFSIHHDNNHWLNTLYLHFLGSGRPWWTYHLLAEATGMATVIVGWLLARRSLSALILLGASEFLVEYSTDARGYAPAGFFALLCLWLLQRHLAQPRRWTAAAMSCAAVLGILSHLTFVVILAGLIAASVLGLHRAKRGWIESLLRPAMWWAAPAVTLAALYFYDVRVMTRGGGPPTPNDFSVQSAAMILGFPADSAWGWWAALITGIAALALCALQLWRLFRSADSAWPVFAAALATVPVLLFFWPKTDYLHPRYLYVAVPLLLILIGMQLDRGLRGRGPIRLASAACLILYCLVNAPPMWRFLTLGKGDYVGALTYLLQQTQGPQIIVGTPQHPTSTMMVLQYYDRYHVKSPKDFLTLRGEQWQNQWPQWIIEEEDVGPVLVTEDHGVPYHRTATFPKGAVASGIAWTIYEADAGRAYVRQESLQDLSK
jgi:hypothetical protein